MAFFFKFKIYLYHLKEIFIYSTLFKENKFFIDYFVKKKKNLVNRASFDLANIPFKSEHVSTTLPVYN
jgi:hypothetical protein